MNCNYAYEGTANVHLQFMDRLPAPRNTMPIIVPSYQHCYEQQFPTLSCALYAFFFSNTVRFSHTSAVSRLHSSSGKKRVRFEWICFHIEINILSIFNTKYTTKSTSVS